MRLSWWAQAVLSSFIVILHILCFMKVRTQETAQIWLYSQSESSEQKFWSAGQPAVGDPTGGQPVVQARHYDTFYDSVYIFYTLSQSFSPFSAAVALWPSGSWRVCVKSWDLCISWCSQRSGMRMASVRTEYIYIYIYFTSVFFFLIKHVYIPVVRTDTGKEETAKEHTTTSVHNKNKQN